MKTPPLIAIIGAAILAMASAASATVIFSDDFTGVTNPNSAGWYFYNTSTAGIAWDIATSNTPPLSGNAMRNPTSSGSNTVAIKQFATQSLSRIGDQIEIRLDFRSVGGAQGQLQVSLLGSANTVSANQFGGTNPISDADGYGFYHLFKTTANSPSYLQVTDSSTTSVLFSPTQTQIIGDNLGHTLTFRLTLTAAGLELSSSIDNTAFTSYLDASAPVYTAFDTVRIAAPGPASSAYVYFDNIMVKAVPEPSALMLLAAGLAVGCLVRRRFNRATGASPAAFPPAPASSAAASKPFPFTQKPPEAFTLVEILTCIAILAILAVLVFPVVGKVTNKATLTKCLGNHRQITRAYLAWLGDHNGKLWYRAPGGNWGGGSGPLFGAQNYPAAPGYLCQLLEPYGLTMAKWSGWKAIPNADKTVWYCPASYRQTAIAGHGATYYYRFLGNEIGATSSVTLAAVSDHLSKTPYLRDYYGNHEDSSQLYFSTKHNVYSYLDGHSEYK